LRKIQQKNCLPMVLKVVGFKQVVIKSVKLTPKVMIIFQGEDSVLDLDWEERTSHVGRRDNCPLIKQRRYKQLGEGRGKAQICTVVDHDILLWPQHTSELPQIRRQHASYEIASSDHG